MNIDSNGRIYFLIAVMTWMLIACSSDTHLSADPNNKQQVAMGKNLYDKHCAACHGVNLEGQANWRKRGDDGRLPAPPHDDSGHTWHHPDQMLFEIIRDGMVPPHAPDNYVTDMQGWGDVLSGEQIWAILAYIKSRWSEESLRVQKDIDDKAR